MARTIYASSIPIVSAVGHEVDFSIADFVADVRAPTPSAAAELISPDTDSLLGQFLYYEESLSRLLQRQLQLCQLRLEGMSKRLRHPGQRLQEQSQRLDELELRLRRRMQQTLAQQQHKITQSKDRLTLQSPQRQLLRLEQNYRQMSHRLQQAIHQLLEKRQLQLATQSHGLHAVSPLATLGRGYAIVTDQQGHVVQDASQQRLGQQLQARLAKGSLTCEIVEITADQ